MDLRQRHEGHTEVKTDQYWALGDSFETLSDEQKHQRREYLDWYGFTAQWSVLVVFAVIQGSIAISYLIQSGLKYDTPKSPSFTRRPTTKLGWLRKLHGWFQQWRWWMRKSMLPWGNWGTRGEWIGASLWTVWLLYLCIAQTGKDYLHLTKRFGQIGASQLPFLYLLAMRAPYSLAQYLTNRSHEQLKSAHQILARIIFLFFALHGAFYMNFFVLSGFLPKRIKDRDVIFGIISIALFAAISTTALGFIRRRNYRLFYTTHIVIVNLIIVPLYLHVSHIHIFVYEILVVEALHLLFRALRLKTYDGTVKILPGTNLVQVRIPLPAASSALKWKPGQHVYLSRPKANATTPKLYEQWLNTIKTNPFTIASLPAKDKELMLVARTLNGNTKYLADLARSLAQGGSNVPMLPTAGGDIPILPISLEGPYGGSRWLPDMSDYDKVLLVAGGVGATFILPVYRSLVEGHATTPAGTHIRCIWAVQKLSETQWAFPAGSSEDEENNGNAASATENGLLHSSNSVEVYVTRPSGPSLQADPSAEGVFTVDPEDAEEYELQESEQLLSMEEQMEKPKKGMVIKSGRPPIADIVDDVCSKGMRTAVVCCGPARLTEDIRRNVEGWVKKGHDVFWYDETFGW